jgi:hypothetical protein
MNRIYFLGMRKKDYTGMVQKQHRGTGSYVIMFAEGFYIQRNLTAEMMKWNQNYRGLDLASNLTM